MKRTLNRALLVKSACVLLLAGLGIHFLHAFQVERNAAALLDQAERALQANDLRQALTYYTHYLSQEPEDVAALAQYALALEKAAATPADRDRVIALFSQVVQRDPSRTDIHAKLISAVIQRRRLREAVTQLQALLPRADNKAELEHILGWCQEALEDYAKAAASFRRAIALDPRRLESYVLLAQVLKERLADEEQAAEVMDRMVAANPAGARAYLARSHFHREQKAPARAEADLVKALELGPLEPEVLLAAADWQQVKGDLDKARAYLQKGWEHHPRNTAIVKALAGLEVRAGKRADAILVLRGALREVRSRDLQVLLAELLLDQGKVAEAEILVEELRRCGVGASLSEYLLITLFEHALHANQLDRARELLAELHALEGPEGSYARHGSAAVLVHEGRRDPKKLAEARKLLDTLGHKHKDWARIPLLLARIAELEGNLAEAVEASMRAFDLGHQPPQFVARLVQLLLQFKRHSDAEQVLYRVEQRSGLAPVLVRLAAEVALMNANPARALALAQETIGSASRDYRDQLWLARIYQDAGESRKAEKLLRQSVAAAPHAPDTWIALARQLTRMGKRTDALDLVGRIEERLPGKLVPFTLARLYDAMGLMDRAAEGYRKAISQNPDDFVILSAAADFFIRADLPEKAVPCLRELLLPTSSAPQEILIQARRRLALLLASSEKSANLQQAVELLDLNLKGRPESSADQRAAAFVQAMQSGQADRAVTFFEESAWRQPLSRDEQLLLVRLLAAQDEQSRVRAVVFDLLAADSDNPQVLAMLIRSLVKSEEMEQARDYLTRLEILEPASARTAALKKLLNKP